MDPMTPTSTPDFSRPCPVRDLLDRMGERWSMPVVLTLGRVGPLRFTALKSQIPDVSHRMLTQTLRQLERSELVSRTVHAGSQLRVDYALTTLGRSFHVLLMDLVDLAERHHAPAIEARAEARPQEEPEEANPG